MLVLTTHGLSFADLQHLGPAATALNATYYLLRFLLHKRAFCSGLLAQDTSWEAGG